QLTNFCYSVLCILALGRDRGFRPCRKESHHIAVDLTYCKPLTFLDPVLRTRFQVPYPVSPAFATLTKSAGGWSVFFPFWKVCRSPRRGLVFHSSSFFSHSCALFCTPQNSTLFFSSDCALFVQKHPGWGTSLLSSHPHLVFWKAKNDL